MPLPGADCLQSVSGNSFKGARHARREVAGRGELPVGQFASGLRAAHERGMAFSTASPRCATRSCSWLFVDYLEHSRCVLHPSPLPRDTFSFPPPVACRWLLLMVRWARSRCPPPDGRLLSRRLSFNGTGTLVSFLIHLRDPARFSFRCQHRVSNAYAR